jgi:hypothetical protein
MECKQARDLLSLFLDDELGKDTRESLQEHLHECLRCRSELDALRSLVKNVESMGMLKTPEDFLEKFHARTRETASESRLKKLLHLLFFPWHVKIPVEVVSIASVAIILISLFHAVEPQIQISAPQIYSFKPQRSQGHIAAPESRLEKTPQKSAPIADKGIGWALPMKPQNTPEQNQAGKLYEKTQGPAPAKIDQALVNASKQPIEVYIVMRHVEKPQVKGPAGASAQMPAKDEAKAKDSLLTMPAPGPQVAGETEDHSVQALDKETTKSLSSKEKSPLKAQARMAPPESPVISFVKDIIGSVQGSLIGVDYDEQSQKPRTITARIPGGALNEFFQRLKDHAYLKMPDTSTLQPGREDCLVRIHVESEETLKK